MAYDVKEFCWCFFVLSSSAEYCFVNTLFIHISFFSFRVYLSIWSGESEKERKSRRTNLTTFCNNNKSKLEEKNRKREKKNQLKTRTTIINPCEIYWHAFTDFVIRFDNNKTEMKGKETFLFSFFFSRLFYEKCRHFPWRIIIHSISFKFKCVKYCHRTYLHTA